MNALRVVARPLLASRFVYAGADALRQPGPRVAQASNVTEPLRDRLLDALPVAPDTTSLVRVNGAVQVGAGLTLAAGVRPRTSAAVVAGSLIATPLAGHRFWEESHPTARARRRCSS
jgi:uncharacterized membrane protein YphA (DoxX/SURF4 family)